jgi:hypothetical protein
VKSVSFDPLVENLTAFVRGIGIEVQKVTLSEPTFLPGLDIRNGTVLVDEPRLLYPGDILHEAGHIAVADPVERNLPTLSPTPGDEMATLAWSYAAACFLGIAPEIVFHPDGYKGGASALVENFTAGRYVGVPLLQFYGMTVERRGGPVRGAAAYPDMLRWLR